MIRMHITTLLLTALCLGWAGPARAQERTAVELLELKNLASLGSQEAAFLSDAVRSTFLELPQDRFPVTSTASADPQGCDDPCEIAASQERGTDRLVIGAISPLGQGYAASLKLYDTGTGQLLRSGTTPSVSTLEQLLDELKQLAYDLRDRLHPLPRPEPPAPQPAPAPPQLVPTTTPAPQARPAQVAAVLQVRSTPPGARIHISRARRGRGEYAGQTPLSKTLLPVTWYVMAELDEHFSQRIRVRLDPSETERLDIALQRDYPANPYKIWGHVAFWTGLGMTTVGLIFIGQTIEHSDQFPDGEWDEERADEVRALTGLMWGSFGLSVALITAGIVLWVKSPGDKAYFQSQQKLNLSVTGDGSIYLSKKWIF